MIFKLFFCVILLIVSIKNISYQYKNVPQKTVLAVISTIALNLFASYFSDGMESAFFHIFLIILIIGIGCTVYLYRNDPKMIKSVIVSTITLSVIVNFFYYGIKTSFFVESGKTTIIEEEETVSVLTEVKGEFQNYEFSVPEKINYERMTSLDNYVRLEDTYGKIFAVPTCLYTNIECDIESILFTGNDGSSLSYEIFDLILELPEFSPKWTEQDILQFITESTDGTIENIEIISFSTTQKSYYVRGTDSKNKNMLIYRMVALGNTMYRVLEIKFPAYTDINDEMEKEYYVECIYRLSDFMGASEKVRRYDEFSKEFKK